MKPIMKKQRLYKSVIQSILEYKENEQLQIGDRLPSERKLAERLQVSRTTVKEAISVLESNGVVRIEQGVGTFWAAEQEEDFQRILQQTLQGSKKQFAEIVELRQAIESDAAYYAALRITPVQKKIFTKIYEQLVEAEESGQPAVEEDLAFHTMIAKASNNSLIIEVMEVLSNQMELFFIQNRAHSLLQSEQAFSVQSEHRAIYEAIINGQPEFAKQAIWQHLRAIKERHEHEWSGEHEE